MTKQTPGPSVKTVSKKPKGAPKAPIEYITPPNVLKAKLRSPMPQVTDPIAAAEKALQKMQPEFDGWMEQEIAKLHTLRQKFAKNSDSAEAAEELCNAALNIKGLAPTFGNRTAQRFADSLCQFMEKAPGAAAKNIDLVNAHVDAIRAAMTPALKNSDETADALAEELEASVRALLPAEQQQKA